VYLILCTLFLFHSYCCVRKIHENNLIHTKCIWGQIAIVNLFCEAMKEDEILKNTSTLKLMFQILQKICIIILTLYNNAVLFNIKVDDYSNFYFKITKIVLNVLLFSMSFGKLHLWLIFQVAKFTHILGQMSVNHLSVNCWVIHWFCQNTTHHIWLAIFQGFFYIMFICFPLKFFRSGVKFPNSSW
jgi:hypothetical protein